MARSGTTRYNPWNVRERSFFSVSTLDEQLKALLRYAILAPSPLNSQPWRFRLTREGIDVYADRSRRLPASDPFDRGVALAIGAAVANLRIAAAHFGYACDVLRHEGREPGQPLVSVRVSRASAARSDLNSLFDAIPRRHTSRHAFNPAPLARPVFDRLLTGSPDSGPSVCIVNDRATCAVLADLVAEGILAQMADAGYRTELATAAWDNTPFGLGGAPGSVYTLADTIALASEWLLGAFGAANAQSRRIHSHTLTAPALAVLHGTDDTPSLLKAGETLQVFLLSATALAIQASFLIQPAAIGRLRERLKDVLGLPDEPLAVLGLDRISSPSAAMPRRPLESALAPR